MSRFHPPTLLLLFSWALMNDPLSSPRALGEDAQSEGFVPLFNGKDLTGWKVYNGQESAWGTEYGLLFTRGGNGGWLMTEKVYADFELRLEYKMSKRGDSGVALRSPFDGGRNHGGMEIQLLDDKNSKPAPLLSTGAIAWLAAPLKQAAKPSGEWNQLRIVAVGPALTVEINGLLVQKVNLEDLERRLREGPEGAHPELRRALLRTDGHIGLQSWAPGTRVSFRRLQIRELGDLTKK